jgi:hypothetical protein
MCPVVEVDPAGVARICKKAVSAYTVEGQPDECEFTGSCEHVNAANKAWHYRLCMEVDWIMRAFDNGWAESSERVMTAKEMREAEEPLDVKA